MLNHHQSRGTPLIIARILLYASESEAKKERVDKKAREHLKSTAEP
jgi:hypothetical protein